MLHKTALLTPQDISTFQTEQVVLVGKMRQKVKDSPKTSLRHNHEQQSIYTSPQQTVDREKAKRIASDRGHVFYTFI